MIEYFLEHNRYLNFIGIFLILAVAYVLSARRSAINYKLVANALLMQAFLGLLTLKVPWGQAVIRALAQGITSLYGYAEEGARFVFGQLALAQEPWGFVFAFRVLPIVIFLALLSPYCFIITSFRKLQLLLQRYSITYLTRRQPKRFAL